MSSSETTNEIPIPPVERPILCSPYVEPNDHWEYNRDTGQAQHARTRQRRTKPQCERLTALRGL
jgi:type III restriction enzyme